MKRYRCHKVVSAAKVSSVGVRPAVGGLAEKVTINFADNDPDGVLVTPAWAVKHSPDGTGEALVGGYFVRYDDGYESWSPADAFEAGYTEVTD